jgi:hypothetical protein
MNQSAQCLNCETIFDTAGVLQGKTAIVLCPRCRKAVVVKGELDELEAPTAPIRNGKAVDEDDSHAWRVRSTYERPVADPKKVEEAPPPPETEEDAQPVWKIAAMATFMVACVVFMFVRIFYHPAPDAHEAARIEANQNAFQGIVPTSENGVSVAVITEAHGRALEGQSQQQICTNAIFQGVLAASIRTPSGKVVADCSALVRGREK